MNEQDTLLHHLQSFPCTAALPATRYRALQPALFASLEQCYSSLRKQVAKCRYAWKTQWSWHTTKPALCPLHYHNWWGAKGSDKVMAYPMPLLYEMEIPFVGIYIRLGKNRRSANYVVSQLSLGLIWDLVKGRTALKDICVNESLGFKAWPCCIGYTFGCI